jgi:hypothetical protein
MWPFKTIIEKVEDNQRINELQAEVDSLKLKLSQNETQLQVKTSQLESIHHATRDSTVAIDWKTMNAFSIERIYRNNEVSTVIGYLLNNDYEDDKKQSLVKEWTLYCSEAQHEKLCKEFQSYVKDKK